MRLERLGRVFGPSAIFAAALMLATVSVAANLAAPASGHAAAPSIPQGTPQELAATATQFDATCAACHGAGGVSGDRAPRLANSPKLRAMDDAAIGNIIRNGTPGGMPPFAFDDAQLAKFVALIRSWNQVATLDTTPEQIAAGKAFFFGEGDCASCHMVRGRGGSNGPDLSLVAERSTVADMTRMLEDPSAMMGARTTAACPGWAFCPDFQWSVVDVKMRDGSKLRGFARNEAEHSIQLQTLDGTFRSLADSEYASYEREMTSYMPPLKASAEQQTNLLAYLSTLKGQPLGPLADASMPAPSAAEIAAVLEPRKGEWPSYNGKPSSNRFSEMDQINTGNVDRLRLAWMFGPGGVGLETTPVVVDGIMYVTGAKQLCALDARNGRSFWCAARDARQPLPAGGIAEEQRNRSGGPSAAVGPATIARPSAGVASGNGPNRGVAVVGNRVIFTSDDGYLMSVNRLTGGVMWTVPLTDPKFGGRYYATPAPLVIGDLVISGVSGGDSATRGFLAAYKVTTGELVWRFWTVPAPGDEAAKTWKGPDMEAGGGSATWMTGSYDKETDTLYWGVGNPYPSTDGSGRLGDNLYANSLIALDAKTGKLKWHYQFTPHDVHDWDATAPLLLVDTDYQGKPRKLVMQANRNGFFYVLDRITGKFLFAKPFVEKMNWASGIDRNGRPVLIPGREPTAEGTFACPAVRGATNWYATAYNPKAKLFYVMAAEDCGIFRTHGRIYGANVDVKSPGQRFLRAIDPETGSIVWEKPLTGSHEANYSGVLSTAGGLVFHGETAGGFAAVDAKTGKTLWSLPTNDAWRASPMTYMVDGRQYVAVAAGSNIIALALPQ